MTGKHYSRTFANIPKPKQQHIFSIAIEEFAKNGYNAANINTIAREAGISIGSMYSYFSSKERLFLAIIDEGVLLLRSVLKDVRQEPGDFFDKYRKMLQAAVSYAREYRYLHQIYLEVSTEGLSHIAEELTESMEKVTTEAYSILMEDAVSSGELREQLDPAAAAFCLDSLAMILQFSFASKYYHERMKLYFGPEIDEERMIDSMIDLVRNGIGRP